MYNEKELARVFSINEVLGIICSLFAPCSPILFYGIHFKIGSWIITQNNFIGIFLAILSLILLIISYFYLQNLTHDESFDILKDEILDKKAKEKEKNEKSTNEMLWSTKDVVANWNLMFLLSTEAYLSYTFFQMDLIFTMTAVKTYEWTILQLSILTTFVIGSVSLLLYIIQTRLLGSRLNIYFTYMFGFSIIAFFESFLLMTWSFDFSSIYSQMAALSVLLSCNLIQGVGSTVYCRLLMFEMTPTHSASIVESHRFIFSRILASIGFFTSSYVFEVLWLIIPFYICISFMIVMLYAIKRNDYI